VVVLDKTLLHSSVIAKRTLMLAIEALQNASFAKIVAAGSHVSVLDRVETDRTGELLREQLGTNKDIVV
jgi:hypothetical protein